GTCPQRLSPAKRIAWAYFRLLTRLRVLDVTSGLRAYGPEAISLLSRSEASLLDYQDIGVLLLLSGQGLSIEEIPVAMRPRDAGMSLVTLTLAIGLLLAGTILYLVRRDHLHGPYALGWLALATGVILIAAFPRIIDRIGSVVGIYYPPILVCLVAIAALLIKSLISDLERSRQERSPRRLSQ